MFIPYRVVQIKKSHDKQPNAQTQKQMKYSGQPLLLEKTTDVFKYSKNKDSCYYASKNQNHQQLNPSPNKNNQKTSPKQNPLFHINFSNNPQKNHPGFYSINLGKKPQKNPTFIKESTKIRPKSCTPGGRKFSQRYSSVSSQNKVKQEQNSQPIRQQGLLTTRKTECTGWNSIYNIYENQGKQFCFNFSKKIGTQPIFTQRKNRSASIYKNKKMKESMQQNVNTMAFGIEKKPKRDNLFDSYIHQIQKKRVDEKSDQKNFSKKSGVTQNSGKMQSKDKIEVQTDEARLINLEKVYQQWKGHLQKKKARSKNRSNDKINDKKKMQDLLMDGKINGWQTAIQNKEIENLQENSNEENIFFFAY